MGFLDSWNKLSKSEQDHIEKNVLISTVDEVYNWAKRNSLWPLSFATACCGIEMISSTGPKYDLARFGSEVFRATPRQADLLILAGTVTKKMAPIVALLYEQMPEPKYVIAMGNCTITGGIFRGSPTVVDYMDQVVPVDVYLPGCPPTPEALFHSFLKLREKISKETILTRSKRVDGHVYKRNKPLEEVEIRL
ncbi:MAG: NADH-quinone oxidoreductase subunit B [Candidatus Sericytochromatia bacterium]|jgi:NADH-quinone oxidoreductase subunit B